MPFYQRHPDIIEARRLDPQDYDGLCDTIAWCDGRPFDHTEDEESSDNSAGIHFRNFYGETCWAYFGDWIIRLGKPWGEASFEVLNDEAFRLKYRPLVGDEYRG